MEALAQIDFCNRDGSIFIDAKNAVYTVKIIVTSNGLVIVGLELQGIAILLGGLSAYSIWLTLKAMSLANQASVSESPASQSFEILRYIADDPQLYEYFYKNKALAIETPTRTKVLCYAEIMANFLEHIVLQRPSLPIASHEAWMRYVGDHYSASRVVNEFITEHRHWYADTFLNFIDAASLRGSRRATSPRNEIRRTRVQYVGVKQILGVIMIRWV